MSGIAMSVDTQCPPRGSLPIFDGLSQIDCFGRVGKVLGKVSCLLVQAVSRKRLDRSSDLVMKAEALRRAQLAVEDPMEERVAEPVADAAARLRPLIRDGRRFCLR